MRNFDRVAEVYDSTRELPEGVDGRIADAVIAVTRAVDTTRFLEIGVGTGRIALPFLERGFQYTGVDVSEGMMNRLRDKVRGRHMRLELVNSDVAVLPFPTASFDVVVGVHILHLVDEWRAAIAEARRVLVPGGYLVLGSESSELNDPATAIRQQWYEFVAEAGVQLTGRAGQQRAVEEELTSLGAYSAVYRVAHWRQGIRPADLLEQQRTRVFSHSWDVPDDVLQAVHQRMVTWATATYASLDTVLTSEQEFSLAAHRFPSAASGT